MATSERQPPAEPQLQPPGAGLPRMELLVSRVGFALMKPFVSRAGANRWFRAEADRILALARSVPAADLTRRVLVPRLPGLEDSSRYWSVAMTLEHLAIVDAAVAGTVESLAAGVVPGRIASTADVKPGPGVDAGAIDRFESAAREYLACVEAVADLRTRVTYPHPWFGEFTALNWHRLAALHHRVHRKQVERIVSLLPPQPHAA